MKHVKHLNKPALQSTTFCWKHMCRLNKYCLIICTYFPKLKIVEHFEFFIKLYPSVSSHYNNDYCNINPYYPPNVHLHPHPLMRHPPLLNRFSSLNETTVHVENLWSISRALHADVTLLCVMCSPPCQQIRFHCDARWRSWRGRNMSDWDWSIVQLSFYSDCLVFFVTVNKDRDTAEHSGILSFSN